MKYYHTIVHSLLTWYKLYVVRYDRFFSPLSQNGLAVAFGSSWGSRYKTTIAKMIRHTDAIDRHRHNRGCRGPRRALSSPGRDAAVVGDAILLILELLLDYQLWRRDANL